VTGAAGAIGVHVLKHLLEHTDWQIVAVVGAWPEPHPLTVPRMDWLKWNTADFYVRTRWYSHDLATPFSARLRQMIGQVDYIVHLAAAGDVRAITANPVRPVLDNIGATLHLLEFARQVKPATFIHLSSHEVYGPTGGPDDGYREGSPHRPPNPYAASKAASEDACYAWQRAYGVPVILVNTVNNFGPMQRPDKLPVVIQRAVMAGEELVFGSDPRQTRRWVHSADTADALCRILMDAVPVRDAGVPLELHIGGPQLTNLDLAEKIAAALGLPLKVAVHVEEEWLPHDAHYGLDGAKLWAAGVTEYHPDSPAAMAKLDARLTETVRWQAENPAWMVQRA
jgi:dTDP-glucose 4,6-dehydratase